MRSRIFSLLLLAAGCFFIAGCDQPSANSNYLAARHMRFWNGWLVTWVKDTASYSASKGFYVFTKPAPGQAGADDTDFHAPQRVGEYSGMEIHFIRDTSSAVAGKGFYALRQPDGSLRPMTASMTHPNGKSAMQIESLVIDPQPAASDAGPAISRAASESLRAQAQRLNHMADEIDKTPGQIPNFRSVPK